MLKSKLLRVDKIENGALAIKFKSHRPDFTITGIVYNFVTGLLGVEHRVLPEQTKLKGAFYRMTSLQPKVDLHDTPLGIVFERISIFIDEMIEWCIKELYPAIIVEDLRLVQVAVEKLGVIGGTVELEISSL